MTYYTKSNFISTAISTDFAQGATAIPCTSLSGLTGVIKMIISPTDSSRREIVIGTVSGNSLISCTRGVEGTTDQAHSEGEIIEMTLTAADLNDINTAIGLKVLGDAGGTVDNTLMRWDGVGGYTAQDSAVTLTDLGVLYPSTTDVGALGTITNMW